MTDTKDRPDTSSPPDGPAEELLEELEEDFGIDEEAYANCGDSLEVLEYTDEFKAAMKEAAKPVYEQIAADIGSDVTDAYLATPQ